MLTVEQILASLKSTRKKPDEDELRHLPDRKALIKGRLSSLAQVRESKQSMREIARLVEIAIEDGYKTGFDPVMVEKWLEDIRLGLSKPGVREDGEVILDCLGLGVSGSLPEDKRPDLAYDIELLRGSKLGAIYVTEGANRLARDPDGVVSATLLKLMKESNCKLRTPEDVLSPCIERDWGVIHDELEKGAEELKGMKRRLFRRKVLKAERGGFVGEPIPPGFILPILDQAPDGKYEFGKLQKYDPHAEVDTLILREYVRQRGSELKTVRALARVTFPAFEEQFRHMARYSSLRRAPQKMDGDRIVGYYITPSLVHSLATNTKLVGVWHWGDIIKPDNHDKIVPEELFLMAYELATDPGKPKGRAVMHEPLEWSRLLWCADHDKSRLVYTNAASGTYLCGHDDNRGHGLTCFCHTHHFIDKPLTTEVLRRLDFAPYAEEVLAELEAGASSSKWEEAQRKRDQADLEQEIKKWKALLPSCVDLDTDHVDREREAYYWAQIRGAEAKLQSLKSKPIHGKEITATDVQVVRRFLSGLGDKWGTYPGGVRNRLLRLLIERVELRHTQQRIVEATVVWKAGLIQKVIIYLPPGRALRDSLWAPEEDKLIKTLWHSSTREALEAALPKRSWSAIQGRAHAMKLKRRAPPIHSGRAPLWQTQENALVRSLYETGIPIEEIAQRSGRRYDAIICRASHKGWQRPKEARWPLGRVRWEADMLKVFQTSSTIII